MTDLSDFDLSALDDGPREQYAGKMTHVLSVSQLKLIPTSHKGCPRKWALMYLQKCPKIPGEPLIDGVYLHQCIQHFLQKPEAEWLARWRVNGHSVTGRPWRWYAELAMAMLRHVPEQERANGASEPTFFLEIPEFECAIYIKPDFLSWKKFRDWKSTSAPEKHSPWVLQDPRTWFINMGPGHFTLPNDIQARTYAHGLMQLLDWDVIDAEWVYGCKKFRGGEAVKTWPCQARFEREETGRWVRQYVYPLIEFAIALKVAYREKVLDDALLVPHNSKACEASGRFCDAWKFCQLKPSPIALSSLHLPVIPN